MRNAGLLLLAAILGFAVGRLTAPEEGGRGGERVAPPVVAEPKDPSPAPVPQGQAEAPPTKDIVQPTGVIERPDDDMSGYIDGCSEGGVIEIDFAGFDGEPQAWAGWRTIRGGYEEHEMSPDEGERVVRFHLSPAVYDVWWLDGEGRRRGCRAAVEDGKRTSLRAADVSTAGPVPAGLGILVIEVAATWGGGLSCAVTITGSNEASRGETNGNGHATTTLFPGRYVLEIGDHREEVTIVEGQVASHRIAHGKEGDLIVDLEGDLLDGIGIARPGEPFQLIEAWTGTVDGAQRCGLLYVAEGEYDVYYARNGLDTLGVPLGRAVVGARRMTLFRCHLPQGGLVVRVFPPDAGGSVVVRRIAEGEETGQMTIYAFYPDYAAEVVLAPGRYSVTAYASGCEPKRVEVDVAERKVEVSLELVQER